MPDYTQLSAKEIERVAHSISPGEWCCERERPIATLLGSCVAVCLYDTAVPVAGMNHFMLPQMSGRRSTDVDVLLAGDACMEALLNGLLARGAARHRIKAKAFGGAAIIEGNKSLCVGQRNVDFTREWLERERIPLIASDFLGPWSRKVLLVPQNGDAYCRRMARSAQLQQTEQQYASSLNTPQPPAGSGKRIELF